jgi:hypothetical protein
MKKTVMLMMMAVLAAISTQVSAGAKYTPQVYVNTAGGYAYGSMVGAHNSTDTVQQIYCTTEKWPSSNGSSHTWCYAMNSAGTSALCSTWDSHLVEATMAMSDESYISFRWDTTNGNCTHIRIENSSRYKE